MRRTPCTAAAIVAAVSLGVQGQTPAPALSGVEGSLDVILRNGTVIDGTGAPPSRADVGIENDRIAVVGDLKGRTASADVDVSGLYVTPGFINIHSHPIQDGLTTAGNMLTQGVTTEMLNPDGGGPTDIAQQLQRLDGLALAVNAARSSGSTARGHRSSAPPTGGRAPTT